MIEDREKLHDYIQNIKEHDIEDVFFTENIFVTMPYLFMATEYIKKKLSDMVIERGYDYIGEAMCRTDEYCRHYIENIKGVKYNDDIRLQVDMNANDYTIFLTPGYFCKCKSFARNGDIDSYIQEHTRMMGKINPYSFIEFDKFYGNDFTGMTVLRLHKYFLVGKDVDNKFRRELISRGYIRGIIPEHIIYEYCCDNCREIDYQLKLEKLKMSFFRNADVSSSPNRIILASVSRCITHFVN